MPEYIEPLREINVIGKAGEKNPFRIIGHRGLYLFISTEVFDQLTKINEAYKLTGKTDPRPLEAIKIIGRKGIVGRKPFILPGYKGTYLCILEEHLKQLERINQAYKMFLEEKKKEEMKEKADEVVKSARAEIEDAKKVGALQYAPQLMQRISEIFTQLENVLKTADYEKAIELASKAKDLALQAKAETVRAKELEKIEKPPEGVYVYCIIPWDRSEHKHSFGNIGIENSEVFIMPLGDIAAVVSNVPFKEYEPSESNARVHIQVITLVMEKYTVLPMAFGMVFKNKEILQKVIEKISDDLKKSLKKIEGKVEFGLKVIKPKGVEFNEEEFSSDIKALRELAVQSKLGKRYTKRLILNVFYLVTRDKIEAFLNKVNMLEEKYRQLKFQCTGPWPPYNFVEIKIKKGN